MTGFIISAIFSRRKEIVRAQAMANGAALLEK
jgi:hypothetical protein